MFSEGIDSWSSEELVDLSLEIMITVPELRDNLGNKRVVRFSSSGFLEGIKSVWEAGK